MISFREALSRLADMALPVVETETLPLSRAAGRVLLESPKSDQDLPPFDRVTMDGYAVRAADLAKPGALHCIGEVAAGAVAETPVRQGTVLRVMTGAPLPGGADAVVKVEETEEREGGLVYFSAPAKSGQNIHRRGEDLRVGARPLAPGSLITTASIPLLATMGSVQVQVARRCTVAILTSGDELVELHRNPGPGQIRDSNRAMLAAQVESAGAIACCLPIVRDDKIAMQEALGQALDSDVVLLTGGSSMGRYDFSADVVKATGAVTVFEKVTIKPGKPILVYTLDGKQVFCLPGNPVSSFVTFELFVRPILQRRHGLNTVWPKPCQLRLGGELAAPAARDLVQVSRLEQHQEHGWQVQPIRWHGSGDLVSMAQCNALVWLEKGTSRAAGELAPVFPCRQPQDHLPRTDLPEL